MPIKEDYCLSSAVANCDDGKAERRAWIKLLGDKKIQKAVRKCVWKTKFQTVRAADEW